MPVNADRPRQCRGLLRFAWVMRLRTSAVFASRASRSCRRGSTPGGIPRLQDDHAAGGDPLGFVSSDGVQKYGMLANGFSGGRRSLASGGSAEGRR